MCTHLSCVNLTFSQTESRSPNKRRVANARRFFCLTWILVLSAAATLSVRAADGDLDPTFGTGGKVVTDFNNSVDILNDLVLQPDGKVIAVGSTRSGSSPHIALVRYNQNGTLDTSFGTGGKVITQISTSDVADAVAVQPDGKIVIGGSTNLPSSVDSSFALARYNPNGTLDATFGNGGVVLTNIGDNLDGITALAIRLDGKIVVAGFRAYFRPPGEERNSDIALARYNADGSLDLSFGINGVTISDFGPVPGYFADDATSLKLTADGRIIICGDSDGGGYYDFLVARYSADGWPDTTFGVNGSMKTDLGNGYQDGSSDAAIQPDGKIVSVGAALPNSFDLDFAMVRYLANGSLDPTFGNAGRVVFGLESLRDEEFTAVAIQPDGKIIALGDSNSSTNSGFLLFRFNGSGSLDTTFGNGGMVRTPFGSSVQSQALVLLPDARILAGGYSPIYQSSDFILARYLNTSKFDKPVISRR